MLGLIPSVKALTNSRFKELNIIKVLKSEFKLIVSKKSIKQPERKLLIVHKSDNQSLTDHHITIKDISIVTV